MVWEVEYSLVPLRASHVSTSAFESQGLNGPSAGTNTKKVQQRKEAYTVARGVSRNHSYRSQPQHSSLKGPMIQIHKGLLCTSKSSYWRIALSRYAQAKTRRKLSYKHRYEILKYLGEYEKGTT